MRVLPRPTRAYPGPEEPRRLPEPGLRRYLDDRVPGFVETALDLRQHLLRMIDMLKNFRAEDHLERGVAERQLLRMRHGQLKVRSLVLRVFHGLMSDIDPHDFLRTRLPGNDFGQRHTVTTDVEHPPRDWRGQA